MAEDCLPPRFYGRLLWRKQTPGIRISEAGNDPTETLEADEIEYIAFISTHTRYK
jgi:hypothetical protein